MKAVVCDRYGPPGVFRVVDLPKPVPGPDDVLVRGYVTTVTAGTCEVRAFKVASWVWIPARIAIGIRRPKKPVMGFEIAGEVEAVGADVASFKPGDRVVGTTGFNFGAYAEYTCLPATACLAKIPDSLSYRDAVGIPTGGLNALHFVQKADVKAGERVLIIGAAGAIGMFAVQMAKARGAEVTAVDRADKLDMLRSIGADAVVDYRTNTVPEPGQTWDVIIDVVGAGSFSSLVAGLTTNGRLVLGNPQTLDMIRGAWTSGRSERKVLFAIAPERASDLEVLVADVASGVIRMVVDRSFALDEMVAAHRYVEAGDKIGILPVVIREEAPTKSVPD